MYVELDVFGQEYRCDFIFDIESIVSDLEKIKIKIKEAHVLSYCGLELIEFNFKKIRKDSVCNWLFANHKIGFENDIRGCLLSVSTEDTIWTKWRNEGLTGIFYRKITFNPEIQEEVIKHANEKIEELTAIIDEQNRIETEKKMKAEAEKAALLDGVKWNIEERDITDEGGRTKEYNHHIVINNTEYIIKERNVFDVGRCITDKDGLIDFNAIDGDTLRAATIVLKYGKYAGSGIRM